MQEEYYEMVEGYEKDDFITDVQLAYRLIKPDKILQDVFGAEVFTDLRKANLDQKDMVIIEGLLRRARNIQILLRNVHRKHILKNVNEEAERIAEEWARRDAEAYYKDLMKEAFENAKENVEEEVEVKVGVDTESFERLVEYYKQLYLPKAKLYVMRKLAEQDFFPYYHYKQIAQKLMLSGSKGGWFLKLFRTRYKGTAQEESPKRGLFR